MDKETHTEILRDKACESEQSASKEVVTNNFTGQGKFKGKRCKSLEHNWRKLNPLTIYGYLNWKSPEDLLSNCPKCFKIALGTT